MKLLLHIVFLSVSIMLFGQERVVKLSWSHPDTALYFKGASYDDKLENIPSYSELIPWPSDESLPLVSIKPGQTAKLGPLLNERIDKNLLSTQPRLSYQLVYEKRQPKLQIRVNPLFLDPETGEVVRMENFTVSIEEEPVLAPLKALSKGSYSTSSLLAENDWFRIAVRQSGIHRITYEQLLTLGIENPAMAKIFGAGAILLPENFANGSYDDLKEIPVYMEKGPDGLFGPGDYVLFYALGPVTWKYDNQTDFYSQELHHYSTVGYYFVTDDLGTPASPENMQSPVGEATAVVTEYDIRDYYEEEKYNLLKSGREWYGDKYSLSLSGAYPFTLPGLVTDEKVKIRVTAAGRSNEESAINVAANGTSLGDFSFSPLNLSSYTTTFAIEEADIFEYNTSQEVITVQVSYDQPNSNSEAWLNHITVNGRAALNMTGDALEFRDSRSVSFGQISEFRVGNTGEKTLIWDITDPTLPMNVPFQQAGNSASFTLETSDLHEFIAFEIDGTYPAPVLSGNGVGRIENQDLHGTSPPDMIIIYAKELKEQAERLADHRREHDNLDVLLVMQETIFNEFSSGTPNVSAIRNYLKMYYDSYPPEQMVKYLLLFGDGSFDNRDTASHNPNLILTYQSTNSLVPTSSFVSDDFYGLLDTGEKLYDGLLDIGIGRLPVSTPEEAELVVDKLLEYDEFSTRGEWRNFICLIADDEDSNIHMRQANSLAAYIESNYPAYNINKIFMDAYPQETTPTGDRYPDVTRAINDQIKRGSLIINYTGHGGVTGLAHEKIIDLTTIKSWRNAGKFPLFMTATCEFSRYDEYNVSKRSEVTSAGEEVLLNPVGGSIGLFTTTRLVYSGPNHVLNEKFYEIVFSKTDDGDYYRLGDIIAYSKNKAGSGINKRNFTLLGDPAMKLAFPRNMIVTDSINGAVSQSFQDTIAALDFVRISGHIEGPAGNLLEDFNGTVTPIVYDKVSNLKTLSNDGGNPMEFKARNSILYKGNATVTNGKFSFGFYVPKDISYKIGDGKVSYYGYSENADGHGSYSELVIGGISDQVVTDTTGPGINVYMNDSLFRNGGIVTADPELVVYINDHYGINTTGNGIGHDITATLNEDRINAIILNEYYQADPDSYSSGSVRYPYSDLPEGRHSITVKVWDIFNNSATASVDFVVVESAEMLLEKIYNYPNPFSDQTFFNIEHNRPGEELEVVIRIYNLSGTLVSVLYQRDMANGYRIDPPSWKGDTMGGAMLGGGLYIYKVAVKTDKGEEAAGSGRLIIKR